MASGTPDRFAVPALYSASRCCFAASPALAAKKYLPVAQFPPAYPQNLEWNPTGFENLLAEGIAVSDKNGHIYVADSGRGVIFDFSSTADKVRDRWNGKHHPDRVIRRVARLGGGRQRDRRRLSSPTAPTGSSTSSTKAGT